MKELSEADKIKIFLYKKIFRELKQNYIAVPELSLSSAVADMVVVNGDIHIYEIKSKNDSLSRLEKQLERYRNCAHKVTIVCDEKFIPSLLKKKYMKGIGIISIDHNMRFKHIQNANTFRMSPYNYLAYWTNTEIKSSLQGIAGYTKMSMDIAKKYFLSILNEDEIRKVTIYKIKEQYGYEFLERKRLIEEGEYAHSLESRFKNMLQYKTTPLRMLPAYLFKNFI